jgi:RecB family exonuclease
MSGTSLQGATAGLLKPGFLFSQHSLGTYLRCPRRFLLKYIDRQPWPEAEEQKPRQYEEHLERGRTLHTWLERQHLGLDMEPIVAASGDECLRRWWRAAQAFDRSALPSTVREAELPLVVPLGAYRIYARYDYLALDPAGEAVIVDWKTLDTPPASRALRERMQTRVYLYTLVAAGHVLTGGAAVLAERASLLYWFANYPEELSRVAYSAAAYARDGRDLRGLAEKIASQPREAFIRTTNERACGRCNYATLCSREAGQQAEAAEDWLDEDLDFDLDLDDVPEVDY